MSVWLVWCGRFVQIMQARREVARRKEAIRQARLLLMRKISATIHFQRVYRGHMARTLRRRLDTFPVFGLGARFWLRILSSVVFVVDPLIVDRCFSNVWLYETMPAPGLTFANIAHAQTADTCLPLLSHRLCMLLLLCVGLQESMRLLIRQGRAAVLMQCCARKRQAWP